MSLAYTLKTAVVTGASSGIGKAAARALAAQGWRVIAVGKDPGRSAAAEQEIRAASKNGQVEMVLADLSLLADTARAAKDIVALTNSIDVLINNAGYMPKTQVITAEGNEENFVANHLGPFLLTNTLLPLLREAAKDAPRGSVRILNTSSDASEMIPDLNWDDLQLLKEFRPGASYCGTKLANVLFAKGLAKRLEKDGIVAHAMHPGTVDSHFFKRADRTTQEFMKTLTLMPAEQGADTLVWLATADEPGLSTGGYFYQRAPRTPNPIVNDEAKVERLWAESEKIIAKAAL